MPDENFSAIRQSIALFRKEQHFPSAVIDRGLPARDDDGDGATPGILQRTRQRVRELLSAYERHPLAPEREQEMIAFAQREAKASGLEGLPEILGPRVRAPSGMI
jgi:hypothetical protein